MKKFGCLLLVCSLLSACGEDEQKDPVLTICPTGQTKHPISGMCMDDAQNNKNNINNTNNTNNTNNQNNSNNTNNTNNTNNANNMNNVVGPTGPVDPMCVDGKYMETIPDNTADISAEIASYSPNDVKGFIDKVLAKRYPTGQWLVSNGLKNTQFDCIDFFVRETGTAKNILDAMSTAVHECGHGFDLDQGGFSSSYYAITPLTSFSCSEGDTTSRGGKTFARSLIRGDIYNDKKKPCDGGNASGCDFYADVYLDGNPTDNMFDSGDQGFNSLLEETTQYVNSLAVGYAFYDNYDNAVSERDGLLTFLWYLGRYLKLARTDHADAYAHLMGDSCWREAILTVWGRAWLYLDLTKDMDRLGLEDDVLMALVMDGDILDEIERVRTAHSCQ